MIKDTLQQTNIAMEGSLFPRKYHRNGRFSMAMLVYCNVFPNLRDTKKNQVVLTWRLAGLPFGCDGHFIGVTNCRVLHRGEP